MERIDVADVYDVVFNPWYMIRFVKKVLKATRNVACCGACCCALSLFALLAAGLTLLAAGTGYLYADTKMTLDANGLDLQLLRDGSGWRSWEWHEWLHLLCYWNLFKRSCDYYFWKCFDKFETSYCDRFFSRYPNTEGNQHLNWVYKPYRRAQRRVFARLFNLKSAHTPTPLHQVFDATGFNIEELIKIMKVYKWAQDAKKNSTVKYKERYPTGKEPIDPSAVTYEDYNELDAINNRDRLTPPPPPPPLRWPQHWSRPRRQPPPPPPPPP
ncbi:uncharacterized protein LOC125491165 [Plutella xylostella]|uniref:uncharacterized protein LOC125491165 n=1 Tax=Plutella xylostella TaxID=51655 RepID=UPI0020322AF4|nr:uncharacterized protein LOC125491165 [Plutella xylostella]